MNIQITQTQCNSCKSIIPAPNANGAVRLAGTTIDFCAQCAEKAVSFVATSFTMPAAPKPALQRVRLANGAPSKRRGHDAAYQCATAAGGDISCELREITI